MCVMLFIQLADYSIVKMGENVLKGLKKWVLWTKYRSYLKSLIQRIIGIAFKMTKMEWNMWKAVTDLGTVNTFLLPFFDNLLLRSSGRSSWTEIVFQGISIHRSNYDTHI